MAFLSFHSETVRSSFGRGPFRIRHGLVDHPLTSLESLARLAESLPPDMIEHNLGSVPDVVPGGQVAKADMPFGEMVRTIETNGCWMVLPIHTAPAYRGLYEALFDELRPHLPAHEGEIVKRHAVFFLASGGSTTPTHIDAEQGFLLHIRGRKELRIGPFEDAATAQREAERHATGGHRNVERLPSTAKTFHLEPGDGVHVPAFMPHVVHTAADGYALSLAFASRTEKTLRDTAVHALNGRLRRIGLKPAAPGRRVRADRLKQRAVDTAQQVAALR
jgi:hypothetical protein